MFSKWNSSKIDKGFIERIGLDIIKNKQYLELSTGQKRKLHLALALVGDPGIIILDEPTAGLDIESTVVLHDEIKMLKQQGKTIIIASHDIAEVENLSDRIAIINNLISGFIHLFAVSIIIFLTAPIIFKASIPENLLLYFIVQAIFIFTCLLVATVLGVFVKDMNKLTMVSQLLFLPSLMLSGIMFPSDMLPKAFEYLGKIFPATWAYINMKNSKKGILALYSTYLVQKNKGAILAPLFL